jgi:hypothetical protein
MARTTIRSLMVFMLLGGVGPALLAQTASRPLTPEQQKQLEYQRYLREQESQRARQQAARPNAPGGLTIDGGNAAAPTTVVAPNSAGAPNSAAQSPGQNEPAASDKQPATRSTTTRANRDAARRAAVQPMETVKPEIDHGYVNDAKITSIIPLELRPNERVAVNLEVKLAKPISSSELAAQLGVLIDNVPLAGLPAPPVTANAIDGPAGEATAMEAVPAESAQSASVPTRAAQNTPRVTITRSDVVRITLFARTPKDLAPGTKVYVSIYSYLDNRNIASEVVGTALSPTAAEPESSRWITWIILGGVILAVLAGAWRGWTERRASQQKIKSLQETVQSTRAVLGEVTGEAARQSADGPQVRKVEIPGVILEAMERAELGVIVGAGASAYANLPTGASLWLGALERLRDAVSEDQRLQLQKLIGESGSDAAIEPLLSLVGRERVLQALTAELAMEHASSRDFHKHLAVLAQLGAKRFVDLTWDRVLDEMLKPTQARTFSSRNFVGLSEALRAPQVTVIKPYGKIGDSEGLSLTPQEFRRQLSQAPELERCLASLFSAQNLLFVGMSTKAIEQFLSSLPAQLESSGREHFALVPFEWSLELWSQGFAKRYGITVLAVGPDGSDESVTEVLARLVEQAQRRRATQAPSTGKQSSFTGIGTLRSVSLRNIGNFKSIDVEFEDNWNLLLGDNGGGKSTILRAITLALSGNDARGEAMAARLLRNGESSGSIELTLGPTGATKIRTTLVRDGTRVKINSPQVTPLQAGQGLVLGFPALRGVTSTQPTGPTRMDTPDPNVDDVAPLLQERVDTRLNQLKQWVINTALQAETAPSGREAQMLKTFRRVLRDVVPGRHVDFKGVDRQTWTVYLRTDDGEASFDSLSQGTSSILGWVGVLLQRLYGIYPNAKQPEDGPALVLIDEIDAHLHPRWQRKLVTLTREQFPNVQMIASSHSPLLAGAMRRNELRIVERDPKSGEMHAAMPREDLRGQTADEILTSSLFALPTSRSPEAEQLINKYFKLYEKHDRSKAEDDDLRSLENELDQLNYGPSRQMRETQQALEQKFEAQLDGISPEMAAAMSARVSSSSKTKETA